VRPAFDAEPPVPEHNNFSIQIYCSSDFNWY